MSHFIFKAKRPGGEIYSSEKDAADRFELYRLIKESGDEIVSMDEKTVGHGLHIDVSFNRIFHRVKTIEKINFARNLGSMLEAGLALSRALSVLERQSRNKTFKNILTDIIGEISRGMTFSDSLAKYHNVFPQIFISMVHAGEQSGTLSDSLKIVAEQMDNSYSLERRVRGALIYPTVILFVMVIIAILMFIFVIPTLMKTFTELNVTLPFTTRIVLGVSTALQNYGLLFLIGFFVFVGILYWWSKRAIGKRVNHSLILKMPILGSLAKEVNTARTARTLSSLLSAGVPVIESVNITAEVVQNVHFQAVLQKAKEAIKKGDLMSKIFDDNANLYPVFIAEMMSVGEETGKIAEMLLGVARYYEDDVNQRTKDMSTVIEPVLMVIIAAAVGFFAVSMISPIYSLVDAV